jgi:hypothetical protein
MIKDKFTKEWIIKNSIDIVSQYEKGILTLRALHYQLVGEGMTNDINHYKKVINAMIVARWDNQIDFDTFSDLDRVMVGNTKYTETNVEDEVYSSKNTINYWMNAYHKNRWENQIYYPEILIEKKALQGVFQDVCNKWDIALGACKGYPSLTFLHEAQLRYRDAIDNGKKPIIIYFGDYDPSGEDIPRSIQENMLKFGVEIELKRIALMEHQVVDWNLPPAPAKETDTRTKNWTGLGQVELDAVKPERTINLCEDAIKDIFDVDKYDELLLQEREERIEYKRELKEYVNSLKD